MTLVKFYFRINTKNITLIINKFHTTKCSGKKSTQMTSVRMTSVRTRGSKGQPSKFDSVKFGRKFLGGNFWMSKILCIQLVRLDIIENSLVFLFFIYFCYSVSLVYIFVNNNFLWEGRSLRYVARYNASLSGFSFSQTAAVPRTYVTPKYLYIFFNLCYNFPCIIILI